MTTVTTGPISVSVAQLAVGTDRAANRAAATDAIGRAAAVGADLVVLPEMSQYFDPAGGSGHDGEPLDGPFGQAVRAAARTAGITVLAGLLERRPGDDLDSNTLMAISPAGELLGLYRKIHLYDAFGFRESDAVRPGPVERPLTFGVGGLTVGAVTCYDLRFPEIFRWVVDAGADLVALPAAWMAGPGKVEQWDTLVAARAIENTAFIAAAGQAGPRCTGHSRVVGPDGRSLAAAADDRAALLTATVDPARLVEIRDRNPSLANRRFTVVPR